LAGIRAIGLGSHETCFFSMARAFVAESRDRGMFSG
jgi:hypothetical protein